MNNEQWREILVEIDNAEDFSAELFEYAVHGVEILNENLFRCFQLADALKLEELKQFIAANAGIIKDIKAADTSSWIKQCQDLQESVRIANLTFVPEHLDPAISSGEAINDAKSCEQIIKIRYGTGFGTGHHTATKLALELIQKLPCIPADNATALDLGTGSSILALAIAKTYQIKVLAVDNDPLALENARDNIEINGFARLIKISDTNLQDIELNFDLIVANIYAEVLCNLSQQIISRLNENAVLILSGIKSELEGSVLDAFSSLKILEHLKTEGWTALMMRR